MKSLIATSCLALCLLALATGVSAQEKITFADLPLVSLPSPMPTGYGQLGWSNFYYVDPYNWPSSGPGFLLGPNNQDVAFVGSRICRLIEYACFGTISYVQGFELVSARVAGGMGPTAFTVSAYNNGTFLGSANYIITSQMQTLQFPAQWGIATQVVFQVLGASGHLVVYEIDVYTLGR